QTFGFAQLQLAIDFETPGIGWRETVPIEAVVLLQLQRAPRNTAPAQVVGAGADDTSHRGQWCGDQSAVGQRADAHDDIHFSQVLALQVDEAVDQAQLYVETGIGAQEVGNRRGKMTTAEGRGRVDADQTFRCAAQRYRLGPRQ